MNLVGKIFTVLIFLMSMVFLSLVVVLYATYANWRLKVDNTTNPLGLSQQLDNAKSQNKALLDKKKALEDERRAERDRTDKRLTALENEHQILSKERQANERKILELQNSVRDAVAAVTAIQIELQKLRDQAKQLREDIKTAQNDRDANFKVAVDLTDQLHNAVADRVRLEAQHQGLVAQLTKARECLHYFQLNENSDYKAKEPPSDLKGQVTDARHPEFIEVSRGSDDGLRKGHKLEVLRIGPGGQNYVGRVEVLETFPERAVCRPDPKTLQSPIQRGDRVYATLAQAQ